MRLLLMGILLGSGLVPCLKANAADPTITLTGTAVAGCNLTTTGISYDFSGLTLGRPVTKVSAVAVDCHGASTQVDVAVAWRDAGDMKAGVYTFTDTKDTVRAEFCYAGSSSSCWGPPTNFTSGSFPVDLRLTYTAVVAETIRRSGDLRVSYH